MSISKIFNMFGAKKVIVSSNYFNNRVIICNAKSIRPSGFQKVKVLIPCIQILDERLHCMLSLVSVIMDIVSTISQKRAF